MALGRGITSSSICFLKITLTAVGSTDRKEENVAVTWHPSLASDNISDCYVDSFHLTPRHGFLYVLFSRQVFSLFVFLLLFFSSCTIP